ncbi:unnamed protein product [Sphagnum tenellum]
MLCLSSTSEIFKTATIAAACVLAPKLPPLAGPFTNVSDHLAMFTIALTPPHLTTAAQINRVTYETSFAMAAAAADSLIIGELELSTIATSEGRAPAGFWVITVAVNHLT